MTGSMGQSVLICAPKYGGCGLVGGADFFPWAGTTDDPSYDVILCRDCGEDHCFQLTNDNFDSLTGGFNVAEINRIRKMMS